MHFIGTAPYEMSFGLFTVAELSQLVCSSLLTPISPHIIDCHAAQVVANLKTQGSQEWSTRVSLSHSCNRLRNRH